MEEKKMPKATGTGQPKFDVWVYGLPGEDEMKAGVTCEVKMMRRLREQGSDTLVAPSPATLKVLKAESRRKSDTRSPDSTRRELAVEVMLAEGVKRSVTNHFDDGQGLAAFKTGVTFTLVYWPFDKMSRVSRSCDVLFAQVENADEGATEAGETSDT